MSEGSLTASFVVICGSCKAEILGFIKLHILSNRT